MKKVIKVFGIKLTSSNQLNVSISSTDFIFLIYFFILSPHMIKLTIVTFPLTLKNQVYKKSVG